MNNGTSRCDPMSGYYEGGVTQANQCVSPCQTCSSVSICLDCISGYFLSSGSCISCSSNCSSCSSSSVCTSCFNPYEVQGGVCVLNCGLAVHNCTSCNDNSGMIDCTQC